MRVRVKAFQLSSQEYPLGHQNYTARLETIDLLLLHCRGMLFHLLHCRENGMSLFGVDREHSVDLISMD